MADGATAADEDQTHQTAAIIPEGYVDWRHRPASKDKHGGMSAATFVLVVEVLENLAFLANASNLVTYLTGFMHLLPSEAATGVTNFMGTAFLLALLGGFLSDAFFTTFVVYIASASVEFLGLVILTIQARSPSLMPPPCDASTTSPASACQKVSGGLAALLYSGLYVTALGVGGIKGSLAPHGAEQFNVDTPSGRKGRSTFFNYFVFSLSAGGLIAVTLVAWVEDNKGWQWGFGISTLAVFLSIPVFFAGAPFYRSKIPTGSPLTTVFKVLLAAALGRSSRGGPEGGEVAPAPSRELKALNRAVDWQTAPAQKALACTVQEVEDVKIIIGVLPIFISTIMLNCCLAQLSTFSVEQAATMDRRLGSLTVPPASLPVFPVTFIMILAPIYDHVIIPFARRVTRSEMGITHLQRIGAGLVLSVAAMAIAATVEVKRKHAASEGTPASFLWIAWQYLFLGSADLFTLAGLLEFFFSEAPARMRSLATALSWASLAVGYYLSSVLVTVVNSATGGSGKQGWLEGNGLNEYHLERFYWLMCVLSAVNYLHFLYWAFNYKYKNTTPVG